MAGVVCPFFIERGYLLMEAPGVRELPGNILYLVDTLRLGLDIVLSNSTLSITEYSISYPII